MRIDTSNRTAGLGRGSSAGRSGAGADFVPTGANTTAKVVGSAPAQAATGIDAILALQGVDGPISGRRRSVRRGASLLDLLDEIKTDLLIGRVAADSLDRITDILSEARERSTPGLEALLDDIELRARVELAKLGRYSDR